MLWIHRPKTWPRSSHYVAAAVAALRLTPQTREEPPDGDAYRSVFEGQAIGPAMLWSGDDEPDTAMHMRCAKDFYFLHSPAGGPPCDAV